jgi:alpha-tubulin suppressor-like RCC1 family protein
MAWTKAKKTIIAAVASVLVINTAIILHMLGIGVPRHPQKPDAGVRFKLPTGKRTPAIGLGSGHGVILASDGSLWAWGDNTDGWPVLGLGNATNQTSLHRIGNETNWVSIAVGMHHNLAIKSDGTLWAWGQDIYGQLGNGASGKRARQQSTPVPSVPGNDWKQAAVGGSHSVALKTGGTLWAWGNNWAGQLGVGKTNREFPYAVQVGSGSNWVKVWAGILETVAIQTDGSLWYWGDNPDPAIPQTGTSASNILSPTLVSAETNWVDVGFGPWTVLATKSDGTLWAWGRQAHVFTGAQTQTRNATPTRVGTNSDWRTLSGFGWLYHILSKKDGSLAVIQAESGPIIKPLQVMPLSLRKDIVAFAGMGNRRPVTVVLTRDGEVWTWGRILGEDIPANPSLQSLAKFARRFHLQVDWGESKPVFHDEPWQLPNIDAEAAVKP